MQEARGGTKDDRFIATNSPDYYLHCPRIIATLSSSTLCTGLAETFYVHQVISREAQGCDARVKKATRTTDSATRTNTHTNTNTGFLSVPSRVH